MIPRDRIGVVLGREGATKAEIERAFKVKLAVNSELGTIEVTPSEDNDDPSTILRAKDVVTAVGRGFSPERAMTLTDDDMVLDIIDLREIFGKNESDINRIKGKHTQEIAQSLGHEDTDEVIHRDNLVIFPEFGNG